MAPSIVVAYGGALVFLSPKLRPSRQGFSRGVNSLFISRRLSWSQSLPQKQTTSYMVKVPASLEWTEYVGHYTESLWQRGLTDRRLIANFGLLRRANFNLIDTN